VNAFYKTAFSFFDKRIILADHRVISSYHRRKPSIPNDKHHGDALLQQMVESQN